MMRKLIIGSLLILSLILMAGCGINYVKSAPTAPVAAETPAVVETTPPPPPAPVVVQNTSCKDNADCTGVLQCIDGSCRTVASLYKTDCDQKCNYNTVKIITSDGEPFTLNRGKGNYAYAGAIEWKLLSGPDYCPDSNLLVPIAIIKKTTGKILGEEVITIHKGETSKIITHPTIARVRFTVKVDNYTEICS